MRLRHSLLIAWLVTLLIAALACSSQEKSVGGGAAINQQRRALQQQGAFSVGDQESTVDATSKSNGWTYQKLWVSEFVGGTLNKIVVTKDPNQPYVAYVFLPDTKGGKGTLVVADEGSQQVVAVLSYACNALQIFLHNGGVTTFGNSACAASGG